MSAPFAWRGSRPHKYKAKPQVIDGEFFASKKEAKRWAELQLMQRAGYITDLERQVRYPLIVNGELVTTYVADAVYQRFGKTVVEDTKGVVTDVYRIKRNLMSAVLGIKIEEV